MAIPVRIEAKAWTDPRYQALAIELGMARARHALIAVADIWQWQTEHYTDERPTYCVPRAVIVGALEHRDGPEAMVAAGLAEAMPDGTFRIRGGKNDKGESRIDWFWRGQQQRSAAGLASSERRKKAGDPRGSDGRLDRLPAGGPTADQRRTNGGPTDVQRATERPPSSPVSDLQSQDPENTHTARAGGGPVDAHAAMALELHDRWTAAGRALSPRVGSTAKVGTSLPDSRHLALIRVVVARWASEAQAEDRELRDVVDERWSALVATREAIAERERTVKFWAAPVFWSLDNIDRDLAQTAEEVRARASPATGRRHPPRQQAANRGQVTTTGPHVLDGEIPI